MSIPKIIHQVWINKTDPELPAKFKKYRDTWLVHHPEWEYRLWNLDNIDFSLLRPGILEQCQNYAQIADVLRLEIIYRYGGIYVDTDFECFRAIDPLLLDNVANFACSEEGATISVGIFGAVPFSPLIKRLIGNLPSRLGMFPANVETGPIYITKTLLSHGFDRDLTIFPTEYFYPYNWLNLHRENDTFPDAYGAHRYAHSWKAKYPRIEKLKLRLHRLLSLNK